MGHAEKKYIAIMAGKWSTNIGNAFFNLGAEYILRECFPDAEIKLLSDQSSYWNLYPMRYRKEPKYSLKYNNFINPDYIVLQGSLLTRQFPGIWGEAFEYYKKNNIRVILLGVGQFEYTKKETIICQEFLKKYPPYLFVSRDRETFENFKKYAIYAYDGLDNAYFLPKFIKPFPHRMPPYVILNFDKTPEPHIYKSKILEDIETGCCKTIEFKGEKWHIKFSATQLKLAEKVGKSYQYIASLLGLGATKQEKVDNYIIIRTDHQSNPLLIKKMFRGPNSFCDDIPYSYINLYAQTELTLTDRLHAALVTMAYGRPAMLFSKSGRVRILERLEVNNITRNPQMLDLKLLGQELDAEINYIKQTSI